MREADRLLTQVPLRQGVFRPLARHLRAAMQARKSLSQVVSELTRASRTSARAALLLRDLWEVCYWVDRARREFPLQGSRNFCALVREFERGPFSGEEVLF